VIVHSCRRVPAGLHAAGRGESAHHIMLELVVKLPPMLIAMLARILEMVAMLELIAILELIAMLELVTRVVCAGVTDRLQSTVC